MFDHTPDPSTIGGTRRRRRILISLSALALTTTLLASAGLFANAFDRSTTGDNDWETGEFAEPPDLDLQLATYDTASGSCGAYSDHLASGLVSVTDTDVAATSEQVRLCVRNVGGQTGDVSLGVLDLADTEIACSQREAEADQSCGTGAGELSGYIDTYVSSCDASATVRSNLAELSRTPAYIVRLGPGQARENLCLAPTLSGTTSELWRRIQTDRAAWRYAFDLNPVTAEPAPEPEGCTGDTFEPNDSATAAALVQRNTDNQASRCGNDDFYRFSVPYSSAGTAGSFTVTMTYEHRLGDLDMRVYRADNLELLASRGGTTGTESYSNSSYVGDVIVEVYGYSGANNPAYVLRADVNS